MTEACICYSTDKNYLLPSLLSAIQARRFLSPERAVLVFLLGKDDAVARSCEAICTTYGIGFRVVAPGEVDNQPASFARHYLDRLLDPKFTDIIHVDGDTQIAGSLDPLLEAPLAPGQVLATPDPMAVISEDDGRLGRATRAYFRSIGIADDQCGRYFNSGVYRVHRTDLKEIGRECVRLCRQNGNRFRFREQDAFNLAFGRSVRLISFKWNFPVFFANGGYDETIRPHLLHYMSNPRPWQGAFLPWGQPAHRVYLDLVRTHPELAGHLKPLRGVSAAKYQWQQRYKRLVERRTWANPGMRARVERLERTAVV